MTGKNLEIISQIVLWYENSFRIDWHYAGRTYPVTQVKHYAHPEM